MSYHHGLTMAVDALAKGVEQCDSAFYLLESWAEQVRARMADGSGRTGMCGWIPLCCTVLTAVLPMRRLSACQNGGIVAMANALCLILGSRDSASCVPPCSVRPLCAAAMVQGRPVSTVQLNLVVAACCQIGDLK